ncbi:hypothetical protein NC651_007601 [Populus alba x Populus x berolinensis]|nr:hypothetical protein NC651_007601 [Populus alba x Populus x berolinensis]
MDYVSFVLPFPSSAIALPEIGRASGLLRNDGNEQSTAGEEEEFSLRLDVGLSECLRKPQCARLHKT